MRQLGYGAIVILDALGFKGIWAREEAKKILARMKSLRRIGLKLQGSDHTGVLLEDSGLHHRVRCMSDTIVVTVTLKGPEPPKRGLYRAMLSASMIAGNIIFDAINGSPALLFRGCLAAGEMREESDFLIGPVVDEAAERFEMADGPFLWLTPSALEISRLYAETFHERLEPMVTLPYSVPLNNGGSVRTQAFTFFYLGRELGARAETRDKLLEAFGPAPLIPSVEKKRKNAASFLKHLESRATSEFWKHKPFSYRLADWQDLTLNQKMSLINNGLHHTMPGFPHMPSLPPVDK